MRVPFIAPYIDKRKASNSRRQESRSGKPNKCVRYGPDWAWKTKAASASAVWDVICYRCRLLQSIEGKHTCFSFLLFIAVVSKWPQILPLCGFIWGFYYGRCRRSSTDCWYNCHTPSFLLFLKWTTISQNAVLLSRTVYQDWCFPSDIIYFVYLEMYVYINDMGWVTKL